jgi:DNA-binding transcriptional ArsR family regulator
MSARPAVPADLRQRLWLPGLLRDVADAFGEETALRLARELGGRYVYLPKAADRSHPVARVVGVKVLRYLIERHDELARIVIPKGPDRDRRLRARLIAEMTAAGRTADQIAAATGLHVRTVHYWRARLGEAGQGRQGELFQDGRYRRAG